MEIQGRFAHMNINVRDLDASLDFYRRALGLTEMRRKQADDGSFVLCYLTDGHTPFELELTWLRDRDKAYDLGDNETHLCFTLPRDAYERIHQAHREMGCVCYENPAMGLYFISDPDGYWLEMVPER